MHLTCGRCGKDDPLSLSEAQALHELIGATTGSRPTSRTSRSRACARPAPARGLVVERAAPGRTRTAAPGGWPPSASRRPGCRGSRPSATITPFVHHHGSRAELQGVREVVGDHQHRDVERPQDVGELATAGRIEVRGRLVEHQDLRLASPAPWRPPPGAAARSSGGAAARSANASMPTACERAHRRTRRARRRADPRLAGPNATSSRTVGMNS